MVLFFLFIFISNISSDSSYPIGASISFITYSPNARLINFTNPLLPLICVCIGLSKFVSEALYMANFAPDNLFIFSSFLVNSILPSFFL